jgi:hypothetical protein
MALSKKEEQRVSARIFSCLSLLAAVVLLVLGVMAYKMGSQTIKQVNEGLVSQKIYFPPAGSPAFSAEAFPAAQKYAGKQVDDGAKAKAYAEDFLGEQVKLVGGGKTLSEISAAVAADPTNAQLQQLQATMFQMETSRTLMLTSGYGASAQGTMIRCAGLVALVAGLVLLLVAGMQMMRYKRLS